MVTLDTDSLQFVENLLRGGMSDFLSVLKYKYGPDKGTHFVLKSIQYKGDSLSNSLGNSDLGPVENSLEKHLRLQHPNIVELYGYFIENNKLYSVIEYISGKTLAAYAVYSTDYVSLLYIMRECFRGLAEIHRNGIVHGDISMDNIMISKDLSQVKIIDLDICAPITKCLEKEIYAYGYQDSHTTSYEVYQLSRLFYDILTRFNSSCDIYTEQELADIQKIKDIRKDIRNKMDYCDNELLDNYIQENSISSHCVLRNRINIIKNSRYPYFLELFEKTLCVNPNDRISAHNVAEIASDILLHINN